MHPVKTTAQRQVTWNLLMCPDWDSNQGSGERQWSEKLIEMIYTINIFYFATLKVYLSRRKEGIGFYVAFNSLGHIATR